MCKKNKKKLIKLTTTAGLIAPLCLGVAASIIACSSNKNSNSATIINAESTSDGYHINIQFKDNKVPNDFKDKITIIICGEELKSDDISFEYNTISLHDFNICKGDISTIKYNNEPDVSILSANSTLDRIKSAIIDETGTKIKVDSDYKLTRNFPFNQIKIVANEYDLVLNSWDNENKTIILSSNNIICKNDSLSIKYNDKDISDIENKSNVNHINNASIDKEGTNITINFNGLQPNDFNYNTKISINDNIIDKNNWSWDSKNNVITLKNNVMCYKNDQLSIQYKQESQIQIKTDDCLFHVANGSIDANGKIITLTFNGDAPSDFYIQTVLKINGNEISKDNWSFEGSIVTLKNNVMCYKNDKLNIKYSNDDNIDINTSGLKQHIANATIDNNGKVITLTFNGDVPFDFIKNTTVFLNNTSLDKNSWVFDVNNKTITFNNDEAYRRDTLNIKYSNDDNVDINTSGLKQHIANATIDNNGKIITLTFNGDIPSNFANNTTIFLNNTSLDKNSWVFDVNNKTITFNNDEVYRRDTLNIKYSNDDPITIATDNVNEHIQNIVANAGGKTISITFNGRVPNNFKDKTIITLNEKKISDWDIIDNVVNLKNDQIFKKDPLVVKYDYDKEITVDTSKVNQHIINAKVNNDGNEIDIELNGQTPADFWEDKTTIITLNGKEQWDRNNIDYDTNNHKFILHNFIIYKNDTLTIQYQNKYDKDDIIHIDTSMCKFHIKNAFIDNTGKNITINFNGNIPDDAKNNIEIFLNNNKLDSTVWSFDNSKIVFDNITCYKNYSLIIKYGSDDEIKIDTSNCNNVISSLTIANDGKWLSYTFFDNLIPTNWWTDENNFIYHNNVRIMKNNYWVYHGEQIQLYTDQPKYVHKNDKLIVKCFSDDIIVDTSNCPE